ncbi:unnamed protein product [Arctia plantaginis]|uniref:Uncharacterized protein n=1 Tax=Arctia plantaginis TaxID=874455 RepID=A0A8S1AKS7_ARCPL|nr:unnamed protein product [Arctia plantaginis]CAB3249029.1 unnamed protein product [Arctia plantaginis]
MQQSTFENENMAIGGWGKSDTRSESQVKLRGWINVVNNNECAKVYDKVNRAIMKSQIYAGSGHYSRVE